MFVLLAAALVPQPVHSAPHREGNAAWNVNFERRHAPSEYYGEWPGHTYNPSPADWRALSIYQLLTDRFVDGDPRNNEIYEGEFDVRDMAFRHGGDFAGLRQKLPYIKGLGCRAIWISPVFQNGRDSYHQYAMHDFTLLDRRLGTLAELRELTDAAHALGMYVVVDVVMNHMANEFAFEGHERGVTPFAMHDHEEYKLGLRNPERQLFQTPAGEQPYEDFWYNNTWDPQGTYGGPIYGRWGESEMDSGRGTYSASDFHHNGDLMDYASPWQIHMGKIYGTMDDLRLESRRVQENFIAMSKALISSVDVDGFRVDTPMQVPLEFFKAWAPAVREHALSLGKERFGLFGEFFVQAERFSTMTGRGKTPDMYGTEAFIDGPATMKGGIDYTYYWYLFTSMVSGRSEHMDGFPLAYTEEGKMLDLVDPSTGEEQFAMWTFCNNHDNWRMQVMSSPQHMRLCQALISFWPGVPLHYAGDEQDFNTPGSALDGWAREELSVSAAWRAATTAPGGNPANGDNFDMTSPSYLYIHRLNALRAAYFGAFGAAACDRLAVYSAGSQHVLAFSRACQEEGRLLFAGNFDASRTWRASFAAPWPEGTELVDAMHPESGVRVSVGPGGAVAFDIPALQAYLLVPDPVRPLPPSVVAIVPAHGSVVPRPAEGGRLRISLTFSHGLAADAARAALRVDGRPAAATALVDCEAPSPQGGCLQLALSVDAAALGPGVHSVELGEGVADARGLATGAAFRAAFVVATAPGPVSDPGMSEQPGLICNYLTQLCHRAPGASWLRIQTRGSPWTAWRPYEAVSDWPVEPGRGVLVQYHVSGSSSYIVGDCVVDRDTRCYASWHGEMFLRHDANTWGTQDEGRMELVDHFTWAANMSFDRYVQAKFAPFPNWDKSYGKQRARDFRYNIPDFDPRHTTFSSGAWYDGTEAITEWMSKRGLWPEEMSMVSGADFSEPLWLSHLCSQKPPYPAGLSVTDWQCYNYEGDEDYEWCSTVGADAQYIYAVHNRSEYMGDCNQCECCRKAIPPNVSAENHTCCILFNDLRLNYSVTSDLSRCNPSPIAAAPPEPQAGSLLTSECMAIFWAAFPFAVALVGVLRKRSQSVVRIRFASDQVRRVETRRLPRAMSMSMKNSWSSSSSTCASKKSWSSSSTAATSTASLSDMSAAPSSQEQLEVPIMRPTRVLFASLEHVIEHRDGREKAIAGGLGKVAGLLCRYHPGDLVCVTACMPGKDYSFATKVGSVRAVVSGTALACDVLRYEVAPGERRPRREPDSSSDPPCVSHYVLDHPMFRARSEIYPAPQTSRRTLEFYSLWCQAVARIIDMEQPDIFHCPDFHAAMSVMYLERPLPVLLVLHNAEYQGSISTQHMGQREARHLASIFNVPASRIVRETFIEGKFCMLKPVVHYIKQHQRGAGVCAVSRNYALEASLKHAVFWGLPEIRGIENCMPEGERAPALALLDQGEEFYARARATAKAFVQERYGLAKDPNARMFVFLGRWVKQKGVDYIADVAEWMLRNYPTAQLVMIGPVGDCYGSYARAKLESLKRTGLYTESLFVHADFLEVPQELKLACDFCLMPSRDEPFGYVDIEFAWFGAAVVGSLRGGLGKLPGFYFQILNSDSASHMQKAMRKTIARAMACPADALAAMSASARASAFPVARWQSEMLEAYEASMLKFFATSASPEDSAPPPPTFGDDVSGVTALEPPDAGEFLRQEASEAELQSLVDDRVGREPAASAPALMEKVEWERELAQEESRVSRFLGRAVGGAPIVDWTICLCYMSGPLIPAITLAHVEDEDAEAFAVWRPAAQAVALLCWTYAACLARPNALMAAALASRLLLLGLPFAAGAVPALGAARFAAAALGVVSSADHLFLYYSFMGSSVGDVATLAMRTGLIMAVRKQWEPLFAMLEDPSFRIEVSLTVLLAVLFAVLPMLVLLQAPTLYRVFSVPELSFRWVFKLRFLMLFGMASVIEALSETSSAAWVVMRQMRPFELEHLHMYCFALALATALPMAAMGLCLRRFPSYAVVMVKAFACCSLPATILQCYAQAEVDRAYELSRGLDALIFASTAGGALAVYAGAVAVLATVGSRWRFVSYTCAVGACSSLARAASFYLIALVMGERDVLHSAHGLPALVARRLLVIVVPACLAAMMLRLAAFFFFEREATGMLRTWRNKSLVKLALARKVELVSVVPNPGTIAPPPRIGCTSPSSASNSTAPPLSSWASGAGIPGSTKRSFDEDDDDVVNTDDAFRKSVSSNGPLLLGASGKRPDPDVVIRAWPAGGGEPRLTPRSALKADPPCEEADDGDRLEYVPKCFLGMDMMFKMR